MVMKKILSLSQNTVNKEEIGKMVNILSNDFNNIDQKIMFVWVIFLVPVGYGGALFLLIKWVGIEGLIALGIPLLFIPIIGLVNRFISKMLVKANVHKDKRVSIISDMVNLLKNIKMYAWEKVFQKMVKDEREK